MTKPTPFSRQLDLLIYCGLMLIGLLLIVVSIGMKHLAATFVTGGAGFWVLFGAIRYGAMAKQIHR